MNDDLRVALNRAVDAGVRVYFLSPNPNELQTAELNALHRAIEAAIVEWEAYAPPRGDGYDCAHACAHHCVSFVGTDAAQQRIKELKERR